jgi:hypothetical protein
VTAQIEPDYFQFYARREGAAWASDRTTDAGYEAHLWSNGAFVTIGTARKFGTTAVVVAVWDSPPDQPDEHWQHVAEVSLEPGGPLEVFSWGNETPAVVVPIDEGWVRLRVLWSGLVAGRYEGVDEDGNSDKHLTLQVWGAPPSPSAVVRWWSRWALPYRVPSRATGDDKSKVSRHPRAVEQDQDPDGSHDIPPSRPHARWGENSFVYAVLFDPVEQTWWVDGSDIRRTLREITQEEAQELMSPDAGP